MPLLPCDISLNLELNPKILILEENDDALSLAINFELPNLNNAYGLLRLYSVIELI